MARSRRRERELARRRYERRRMREQQVRARRRRRNTIAGAVLGTVVVLGGVAALALTFVGGSGTSSAAKAKPSSSLTPFSATPTPSTSAAAPTKCAPIKPNPPAKADPVVPPVKGKPPTKLVVKDLKAGHGPAAKVGDKLTVNYVGVACSTGKAFDASYPRHQPFTLTLGQHKVIKGWEEGLVGMKAGGRRELIIPPSLGYGAGGSGPIGPNETLIFVVDLVKIG